MSQLHNRKPFITGCSGESSKSLPYENLKSFPFKRAPQKCFELDFWASAWVDAVIDSEGENDPAALAAWQSADRFGRLTAPARETRDARDGDEG